MATADRAKSGRLTLSEFIRSFLQNMDVMLIPVAAAQEKMRSACLKLQQMHDSGELEKLVTIFESLDKNKDGYLDRTELAGILTKLFHDAFPEWDDETLSSVMTAVVVGAECHHDGKLSL
uniref:EF-hand domain-containing protein n=1 Tax=Lygus hesperus TaxID=30085 RepID=A0A146LRT7_LYGHE